MPYLRIILMVCQCVMPQLVAGQICSDIHALVENSILGRKEPDILNACNFIIQGRSVTNTDVQTSQIADAIMEDEIIIEFFACPDSLGYSTYWAFVIKKDMKTPLLCEICKETELASLIDEYKNFYNNADVLNLMLHSIKKELDGVNTVYYTPCGKLHEIALEYCIDVNCKMFCENYNVFRLTSSSMICTKRHRKDYYHYSIWGGVNIEEKLFECQEDTCLNTYDTRQLGYLEDSFKAAKQIVEELKKDKDIVVDFFHDNTTTEENFKAMSGKGIDAFLIETHGIFTRGYSISPKSNQAPLDNHSLALCGASTVIDTGIIPDKYEDGLITESEIAQLDFSSMDLAVISACKSGLGEFKWDGVYGLMRGFKKAGVKSLVMALDDVVDYVSGQLWIQFFRNLTNGQSKRESLLNGIRYIRTMDKAAYSHPKYWTPYILIDGIE